MKHFSFINFYPAVIMTLLFVCVFIPISILAEKLPGPVGGSMLQMWIVIISWHVILFVPNSLLRWSFFHVCFSSVVGALSIAVTTLLLWIMGIFFTKEDIIQYYHLSSILYFIAPIIMLLVMELIYFSRISCLRLISGIVILMSLCFVLFFFGFMIMESNPLFEPFHLAMLLLPTTAWIVIPFIIGRTVTAENRDVSCRDKSD